MSASLSNSLESPAKLAVVEIKTPAKEPGRIYLPLPKMWIGMSIATLCLLFQFALPEAVALTSMIGSWYWLFCIFRMHVVLAEYSCRSYPISPRKALLLQMIPLFGYYWVFRWTRQMAKFVKEESAGTQMAKVWPALLLVVSSILGWVHEFKSMRLFVLFSVGIYFTSKLRAVLPACRPLRVQRWQQWNLAMSAGLGAAYSLVIAHALHARLAERKSLTLELVAALFVSLGLLVFLDPLFERLRQVLGIAQKPADQEERRRWPIWMGAFLILLFASLSHSLLETGFREMIENAESELHAVSLLAALLVTGGITYFWVVGAYRHPSRAARTGFVSGTVLAMVSICLVLEFFAAKHPQKTAAQQPIPKTNDLTATEVAQYATPDYVPKRSLYAGGGNEDQILKRIVPGAFRWPIVGLLGGLFIDRRWGRGKPAAVAVCVLAVATLYELLLWRVGKVTPSVHMVSHLSIAAGWALSLVICSSARVLMPHEAAEKTTATAPATKTPAPA